MRYFFDVVMLLITSWIVWKPIMRVSHQKSRSLADYAIILLYLFQCVPVICDIILGIPSYDSWFRGFETALNNDTVCIIYDFYIIILFCSLLMVTKRANSNMYIELNYDAESAFSNMPNFILFILIISPFIHLVLSGNLNLMYVYTSYSGRGLASSFTKANGTLVIVSILAFFIWLFKKKMDYKRWIAFFLYGVLVTWVNGKRYVAITVIYAFFYLYTTTIKNKRRKSLLPFLVVVSILVVIYSAYYLINIREIGDAFSKLYASLRIDFGRDDVVKFTILKEYIEGEHILDYPCQTVISTFFMVVPRAWFPAKAYPHYAYLTAAIYGKTIENIPAGMTPSILEMMIANFRWFGIPLCIIFYVSIVHGLIMQKHMLISFCFQFY